MVMRSRSKQRQRLFWLILLGILLILVEGLGYVGLTVVNRQRNIFYGSRSFTRDMIDRFIRNSFDPELGWNIAKGERNNLGTRRKHDYAEKPIYKMKAFGDSFVYGAEVEAENTVCAYVEKIRSWDCLNYGVGAYGTDQALLKYQRTSIKSEYVVLGVLCENIGRVVSRYPGFYMRIPFPPKPRFIEHNGNMEVLPNPTNTPQRLYRLLDSAFIDSLKENDYWPFYYEQILHAPDRLRFPALWTLLNHSRYFFTLATIPLTSWWAPSYEADTRKYKYYHLYQGDTEALRLMKYLIDEFVRTAQGRDEKPVVVLFVDQYSLDLMRKYDRVAYAPLMKYLQERHYPVLDVGSYFRQENYPAYFNSYNSHYSAAGNYRVAELLIRLLENPDGNALIRKNPLE